MPVDLPARTRYALTSSRPRYAVVVVYTLVALAYVVWRAGTLNPDAPIFSALVFGAELFGIVTMFLLLLITWRLPNRRAPPPPHGLTVDVFVTTYNEPVDVVRRTLLAAVGMDHAHQTWLLDDGNRPQMQALAERLGCRYLARADRTHAKAGNLNHGLAHSKGDIVVLFDADHAPHSRFLVETLGYFRDEAVAFVQTPQEFYNLDSYQHRLTGKKKHLWTEQSLFFNVIQRGKDYWNAAFFCGSCALLRRRALQDICGFATGSVTEDLHTSLRLHEKGYNSVYHPHPLAYGIAVLDAGEYMQQRLRWGQGAMQVWRRERVLSNRKLTLPQRLNYFSSIITYFEGWQRAIFYTVPAYALLSGTLPIHITVPEFLLIFLSYLAITFWTFGVLTRGHSHLFLSEEYNFARFAVFCQSTLGVFRRRLPFVVSGKKRNPHPPTLAPLYPQLLVLGFNAVAIPVGFLHYSHGNLALAALIANVFWAGFVISIAIGLLRFTRINARDRRQEYRFAIPICARIHLEGQPERLVTVDNLSAQGFGFHGGLSGPIEAGKEVAGFLHIASGPMPFFGWIRSVTRAATESGPPRPVYGCQFEALPEGVVRQLEAFLHGNDLQWHFLRISEQTRRLLGPHRSDVPHGHEDSPSADSVHWRCCTYSDPVEPALPGIISATELGSDGDRRMVVMQRIPKRRRVVVRVEGADEAPEFAGEVREEASVRTADGPVYLYTLQHIRSTTPWTCSSAYA